MSLKDLCIRSSYTIKQTLKKLDETAEKVLLVISDVGRLLGTISDGDIRRSILAGKNLEEKIETVYNNNPVFFKKNKYTDTAAKELFLKKKINLIPIVDDRYKVIDFVTWNQIFAEPGSEYFSLEKIDIPVVIMAGGKGTRLKPFSNVFPKPLLPIGDKTVLDTIIDEFSKYSIAIFYLTLNYKGKLIELYINDSHSERDYNIEYIWEDDFYGTAGSLKSLEQKGFNSFIVSNCDVIVRANYNEVLKLHKEQNASLTIVSSIRHYEIPYGVVKFSNGGEVENIIEKPEQSFTVNTGVYIVNVDALKFIPEKTYFDMPDLISVLKKNNKKIFVYPVNENDFIDIGQWEEYKKALDLFGNR